WIEEEERLAEVLAAADVFVMPSLAESFGLMALEAMACATPVVVTAGTAMVDTVRAPEAGLTAPPGDADALASALSTLLADPTRRAAMGEAGRAIVERDYSFTQYVQSHVDLYHEVSAERAAGRR